IIAERGLFSSWATMETNRFLSCSAFHVSVTSFRMTIAPPASPSRRSGEMLPCRRLWPPWSWTSRHSGRSGAESITASMAAAVSRSGKRSGRLMPSRKWVPRKCSARGFMRTGSRRMLSTTTPSCIELIIWCERLRSPASSERYFSRSWIIRPCCAALSTTQMRFSGLLGLTRKSNAPWRVTSTAASAEAPDDLLGERGPLHARHSQGHEGHFGRRLGEQLQGSFAIGGGAHDAAPALQDPPQPLAHPLLGVDDDHTDGFTVHAGEGGGRRRVTSERAHGGPGLSHAGPLRTGTVRSCPEGARGAPAW